MTGSPAQVHGDGGEMGKGDEEWGKWVKDGRGRRRTRERSGNERRRQAGLSISLIFSSARFLPSSSSDREDAKSAGSLGMGGTPGMPALWMYSGLLILYAAAFRLGTRGEGGANGVAGKELGEREGFTLERRGKGCGRGGTGRRGR